MQDFYSRAEGLLVWLLKCWRGRIGRRRSIDAVASRIRAPPLTHSGSRDSYVILAKAVRVSARITIINNVVDSLLVLSGQVKASPVP